MGTNSTIFWIQIITAIIVMIIVVLGGVLFLMLYKNRKEKQEVTEETENNKKSGKGDEKSQGKVSIKKFMEFDDIIDNMIVRKNRQQYVMVVKCKGVNYDLLSEDEKIAVENGFAQFLNTLRFSVQLYIQTRSLNLKDIIDSYNEKVDTMKQEVDSLDIKIKKARLAGNRELLEKLEFERRRKVNVLEYGTDISDYIARMSLNRNVLQQNTYVIVSYYTSELGTEINNYSKQEIDNMCFNDLYTRTQAVISSLATAEVYGRILDSEELAELLYVAYNRDDAEIMQLRRALDAEYDSFYSTAPDIMQKKIAKLQAEIEEDAVTLATESMLEADRIRTLERTKKQRIKNRALEVVDAYKDEMDKDLYEGTKEQIYKYDMPKETKTTEVEKTKKVSSSKTVKSATSVRNTEKEETEKVKRGRKRKEA